MDDRLAEDICAQLAEASDGEALIADGYDEALIFPIKCNCSESPADSHGPRPGDWQRAVGIAGEAAVASMLAAGGAR